jgi:lipid II:glycine glycyltransferase (peptidoglycan interpeptide bridge formation enzyme)
MLRLLMAERMVAGRVQPMAGTVFLMFGQTVFCAFNGRRSEELALHPNDLIQWQAIHDACAAGFREYDLGEVTRTHPQLAQFKRKWGAQPEWLWRYYYPHSREVEIGLIESRSRPGQLAHTLWQHLPLPATAALGVLAHRYF